MKKIYKFLLIILIINLSCGVKNNPSPPLTNVPSPVIDLNLKQQGNFLIFYWRYTGTYEDGRPLKDFYQNVLLNNKPIYINIKNIGNLYWIEYEFSKFKEEYCFQIEIKSGRKSSFSRYKCIFPQKFTKFKDNPILKQEENKIIISLKNKHKHINVYKGSNNTNIPPIPFKIEKNTSKIVDYYPANNSLNCYYLTITENFIESNRIYTGCKKYKDIYPPLPPENPLLIKKEDKVIIIWSKSKSPDVAGYIIFKNNKPLFKFPIKTYYFEDNNYKKGDKYYIISIDYAGNKSKPIYLKEE